MKMRSIWLLLFIVLLGCNHKNENVRQRGFDQARIEKYNADERFNYDRVITRKANPVLNFFGWIFTKIAWFLNTVFGYLLLALLIGLLIYVLMKYVNNKRFDYEEKTTRLQIIDESTVDEVDFDKLLAEALAKQDYRLAIRFSFLSALKTLSLRKVIKMKEGKTNYEYYHELPDKIKPAYKQILSVFEYVWYGEFPASKGLYQEVNDQTKELNALISRSDA